MKLGFVSLIFKFQIRLVKSFFKFTFNVNPDCQGNIIFADRTEQGREMNEPVDPMRHDDFLKILEIKDVGKDEWTWNNKLGQFDFSRLG